MSLLGKDIRDMIRRTRFYEKQNRIEILKLLTTDDPTALPVDCQNDKNETEINRKTELGRETAAIIAVSVVLSIFLLVSVVVGIYFFKVIKTLQEI